MTSELRIQIGECKRKKNRTNAKQNRVVYSILTLAGYFKKEALLKQGGVFHNNKMPLEDNYIFVYT